MTVNEYSIILRSPEQEPHSQMQFSVRLHKYPFCRLVVLTLCWEYSLRFFTAPPTKQNACRNDIHPVNIVKYLEKIVHKIIFNEKNKKVKKRKENNKKLWMKR